MTCDDTQTRKNGDGDYHWKRHVGHVDCGQGKGDTHDLINDNDLWFTHYVGSPPPCHFMILAKPQYMYIAFCGLMVVHGNINVGISLL